MGDSTLIDLEAHLGYRFDQPDLLARALYHRSWCAEHPGAVSNERLEYLGDAVLGWVVADLSYRGFPELPEGKLTDLRKAVVNTDALAELARGIELGPHLRLGRGEDSAGGRQKDSILADALEAVIGAVYLDGGPRAAHQVIASLVNGVLDEAVMALGQMDHKTRLQEMLARGAMGSPVYEVRSDGPDHDKSFFATVTVQGRVVGQGEGRSKKRAEQAAAAEACREFEVSVSDGA